MHLNKDLRSVYEWRRKVEGLRYGIEIEIEQAALLESPPLWSMHEDGSLRNNGREMVSLPLLPDELDGALEWARQALETSQCVTSERCGIHLHMNMQDATIRDLLSLMTGYVLVEPYLFKRYAPTRINSAFCVPIYLNDSGLMQLMRASVAGRTGRWSTFQEAMRSPSKYVALNTRCLPSMGTVEFRQLPGTLDMDFVKQWVMVCTQLYEATTEALDPQHLIDEYAANPERFHERVVGDYIEPTPNEDARVIRAANFIAGPSTTQEN